jgi:hypothetical protein
MTTRIYLVKPKAGDGRHRLVRAASQAAALRHVVEDTLEVALASQDDLVRVLLKHDGAKVEAVNAEDENASTN